MTLRQGIEATKPEYALRYTLCVVPVGKEPIDEERLRADARFVVGMGSVLLEKVQAATLLKAVEERVSPDQRGAVELDIVESEIKLRVADSVWKNGKTFDDFVAELRLKVESDAPSVSQT